jgi:hypothetical protein
MSPVSQVKEKKDVITSSLKKINNLAYRLSSNVNNPKYVRKTTRKIENVANKIIFNARSIKKTSKKLEKHGGKTSRKSRRRSHRKK